MSKLLCLSLLILLIFANILLPTSSSLAYRPFVAEVSLGGTNQNKSAIYAANDSVTFTVTVTSTSDVPNTATAKVDFLDFNNPGSVGYAISPTTRTKTQTLAGGGQGTNFSFTMTTNGDNTNTGTVTFQFKLDTATGATKVAPLTANVNVTVQAQGDDEEEGCSIEARMACTGWWIPSNCECLFDTPIIIDVARDGFNLTNPSEGVMFDLAATGNPRRHSWTVAGSDDAFLVLDRNNNGQIDNGTELFGNRTPQPISTSPNGFIALAEYDQPQNGGNGNGRIDQNDSVYASLRLWQDVNHDGVSESSELHPLMSLGVVSIGFDYRESKRQDRNGNLFRYRAKAYTSLGTPGECWAYDVFLRRQ